MTSLLILTVGTGTTTAAGHSDVAQGLANTIVRVRPRKFWLVPSSSPQSVPVADIIRETVAGQAGPESFQPWSESCRYRVIEKPDSLEDCRSTIRAVIEQAKSQRRQGEQLVVNPTGGTKQMSAGATLAALDEAVDQIHFTVGERVDGVVKTGTESIESFDLAAFLAERDLGVARELFSAGAFASAAALLGRHHSMRRQQNKALCCHEWLRFNYRRAETYAATFSEQIRTHLHDLAKADEFSPTRLGDLLASAESLDRWEDHEEALARYYRAAELLAKARLSGLDLRPPYRAEQLLKLLPPEAGSRRDIRSKAAHGEMFLTLQLAWHVLRDLGDEMAQDYFRSGLEQHLKPRHDSVYGHGQKPVGPEQTAQVEQRLRRLLSVHLPVAATCWNCCRRPNEL